MPAPVRTGGGSRLPMRDLIRLAASAIHYLAVFDEHTERPLYLFLSYLMGKYRLISEDASGTRPKRHDGYSGLNHLRHDAAPARTGMTRV
jgi:hypothetical protein